MGGATLRLRLMCLLTVTACLAFATSLRCRCQLHLLKLLRSLNCQNFLWKRIPQRPPRLKKRCQNCWIVCFRGLLGNNICIFISTALTSGSGDLTLCHCLRQRILSLGEEVRLLRASAESRLLARRLESVRLQNALERLGRRTLAGATATSHGGHINISSRRRFGHFIYYARNFHIERGK